MKNPGMGKIEDFIGQPGVFQKLLEEGVSAAHKESGIPYSNKYLNKDKVKALKDDPEFKVINEKYTKEIGGLYGEKQSLDIESIIRYQDGKTATLRTTLQVRTVKPPEEYDVTERISWWKRVFGK